MNEKIEQMLADIYALDASLREHDSEMRTLATTLLKARPQVRPDAAFIKHVRQELVGVHESKLTHAWHHNLSWWMMRVLPLGAVAVLLVMLIPQGQPTIEDTVSPSGVSIQSPIQSGRGGSGIGLTSPSSPKQAPVSNSESSYAADDAFSISAMPVSDQDADMEARAREMAARGVPAPEYGAPQSSASASISEPRTVRVSRVLLERSGFVAVYADKGGALGELLGVSSLFATGVQSAGSVVLERELGEGEVIYVIMHGDNGDGVFSPDDSFIIEPLSGLPIVIPLRTLGGTDMPMVVPSTPAVMPMDRANTDLPVDMPIYTDPGVGGGTSGGSGGSAPNMGMPVSDVDYSSDPASDDSSSQYSDFSI